MKSMNDSVSDYTKQLEKGQIQRAYKGIMAFMSALKKRLESRYPEYRSSALYVGCMDMTYFAFTPVELSQRQLKAAVVYLHEQNRFEVWLGGVNRRVQAAYIQKMKNLDLGSCRLSRPGPGVDSIAELTVADQPDFDGADALMELIEEKLMRFANDMISLLSD